MAPDERGCLMSGTNGAFPTDSLSAAKLYCSRGYTPIPLRARTKHPIEEAWQELRPTAAALNGLFFESNLNVGVNLGDASRGLVDIDLDCPEAIQIATLFI